MAGNVNEEMNELLDGSAAKDGTIVGRIKIALFKFLKQNAFLAVTLAASVSSLLVKMILDSKSTVRCSWIDLWPSLDPVLNFLPFDIHRKSSKQSVNLNRICHLYVLKAFGATLHLTH